MRKRLLLLLAAVAATTVGLSHGQNLNLTNTTPFSGTGTKVKITSTWTNSSPSSGTWYVIDLDKNPVVYGPNYNPGNTVANTCNVSYNSGWVQNGNPAGWALTNDAGTGVIYPNSSGIAYNSQCIFDVGGSSYRVSGNTVTVTWSFTFTNTWANTSLAMWFYGAIGGQCEVAVPGSAPCTGWLQYGTWTPKASTLSVVAGSVSPTNGSGSALNLKAQFNSSDPTLGTWYIAYVGPGQPSAGVAQSCDVSYNSGWTGGGNPSGWSLTNDAGTAPNYANSAGVMTNGQCLSPTNASSYSVQGNVVSMNWNMEFTSAYAGKTLGVWISGSIGGMANTGSNQSVAAWQQVGTFTLSQSSAGSFVGPSFSWDAMQFSNLVPPGGFIFTLTPGNTGGVKYCLYYQGTNPPQPAAIPGVYVDYFVKELVVGSGGHSHETMVPGTQRPLTTGVMLAGNTWITNGAYPAIMPLTPDPSGQFGITDDTGCASFAVVAPFWSGYFITTAYTTNCNLPGIVCYSDTGKVDVKVYNSGISGTPLQALGSDPGYTFLNSQDHGLNGMTADSKTGGYMFNIAAQYNANPANHNNPWTVNACTLPWGGIYDRPSTSAPFWAPNGDQHLAGYSCDVYSPDNPNAKSSFNQAVRSFCPVTAGGFNVFDFYEQAPVTIVADNNNTIYLWHVYCPYTSGLQVYPN